MAEMVETAEHAGDLIRVIEGRGVSEAEADMLGDARHHRQQHGRVEQADLPAATHHGVEAAVIEVVEAEDVGEEQAVEPAGFEHAGDVLVAFGAEDVVDRGFRVAPGAVMVTGRTRHQESDEVHLPLTAQSLHSIAGDDRCNIGA